MRFFASSPSVNEIASLRNRSERQINEFLIFDYWSLRSFFFVVGTRDFKLDYLKLRILLLAIC